MIAEGFPPGLMLQDLGQKMNGVEFEHLCNGWKTTQDPRPSSHASHAATRQAAASESGRCRLNGGDQKRWPSNRLELVDRVGAIVVLIAGHLALKYGIKPPIPSNLHIRVRSSSASLFMSTWPQYGAMGEFSRLLSRLFARQGNPPRPRRHFCPATAQCGLAGVCMGRRLAPLPAELRTIHPTPPGQITVRGKASTSSAWKTFAQGTGQAGAIRR